MANISLSSKASALFAFVCLMATVTGQQPARIDDAALRKAGQSGEEWLTYGLSQAERASVRSRTSTRATSAA